MKATDEIALIHRQQREYQRPLACVGSRDGFHQNTVEGRPLSGNTWYVCLLCGHRKFRG